MKKKVLFATSAIIAILSINSAQAEISTKFVKNKKDYKHSKQKFNAKNNQYWWPDQLDLSSLRDHDAASNPYGLDFDYAEEFLEIDLAEVKADIEIILTDSQEWWPADFGNYGPFFIRMAWHSAGTYRTLDGRGGADGGQQRFDPLNSWPDNGNLDKARRLLWPVKQKYGENLSWSDLMILAANVALENMGFETFGFAGGRIDDFEPDLVYWGPELEMLASDRVNKEGKLQRPLGATHMGLIYVNPEGPMGKPDPLASAKNIRTAFARMAMNDEETVALIAGGHTFGKMHGAHSPKKCLGAEPAAAPIEQQGFGWKNKCGKGHSEDTVTSGLEGAWTQMPTMWTSLYLENLLNNDWVQSKSPAGAIQWVPKDKDMHNTVPDAHIAGKYNPPVMTTADLALKYDPAYRRVVEKFRANPDEYSDAFAKAWFKLTHRDMGPKIRYLGEEVPEAEFLWQDPIPEIDYRLVSAADIKKLKEEILASDLTISELVRTAWASAASFRASDMRGGTNGGRIALEPMRDWQVNNPEELDRVLSKLANIQNNFNQTAWFNKQISLADLIVLAGATAIEEAALAAGVELEVPFYPGRADALQEQTDMASFALLEPEADAFRNYFNAERSYKSPSEMLVDKADQLSLTVPEMTVLIGGMRSLGANYDGSKHGVLTDKPGTLNNDFFVNLLDMSIKWQKSEQDGIYEALDRETDEVIYSATTVDLIFGANSELRAITETYAYADAEEKFIEDFVASWVKVMNLNRY